MFNEQMFVCVAGARWVVGWREAERRPCTDLCEQAGFADSRPGLRDRRGSQSAHHPGSHVADPVLLRPHWRGDSGERTSWVFFFSFFLSFFSSSHHFCCLKYYSRRAWIGSARASTPRRNSFASSLLPLRRMSSSTHTLTHIAPSWALIRWDIPVNVNTLLIHHGLGVFNPPAFLYHWVLLISTRLSTLAL